MQDARTSNAMCSAHARRALEAVRKLTEFSTGCGPETKMPQAGSKKVVCSAALQEAHEAKMPNVLDSGAGVDA